MGIVEYGLTAALIGITAYSALSCSLNAQAAEIAVIYSEGVTAPEYESESEVKLGDDIIGKTAEIGIAPGSDASTQITTNAAEISENDIKYQKTTNCYSNISISASELEELRRVVAAESQTQSLTGRKAVVEVIFNRVVSDKWPNTVHGVLSQKGQFATYKMRYAKWVEPSYADKAIEAVLANGRTVLPSANYVYFDTRGVNGRKHIKIGEHYFGR